MASDLGDDPARQLRIYEEALLRGSTEQSRSDAAIELLRRADDESWDVLLKTLISGETPAGRQAVCRGLVASRPWADNIRSRKPFLEPLLGLLRDGSGIDAQLAAEALTVFRYREVGERLARLARSQELARQTRLNAIYAIRLWPNKEAILELVNLLDDPDAEVALAARSSLPYWVALGAAKAEIREELLRRTPDEIIKARLEGLQQQMARLETERDQWRRMFLTAIDREYERSDEEAKGRMLVERMASEHAAVRLWAVGKTAAFTGPRPKQFRENLLALISDRDRDIRLATARVLANMSVLDPAERLLAQLKVETHAAVSLAIFDALGEACFFAFSPGSPIALDASIRAETLAIAAGYLQDDNNQVAAQGAGVMGKLLELNVAEDDWAEGYLALLAARYEQVRGMQVRLRGELLDVMARLCGSGGRRQSATQLFRQYFLEGLTASEDNAVREASATGLVNIDRLSAFRLLKDGAMTNDSSLAVRRTVVGLAGELGGREDLAWLSERIEGTGDPEGVWQAIKAILMREEAREIYDWARKLAESEDRFNHVRDLMEAAEKKADGEKNAVLLHRIRTDLSEWYSKRGDHPRAIAYCNLLMAHATDEVERERLQLRLLEAFLQTADASRAAQLMSERLAGRDMGAEDAFMARVKAFLALDSVQMTTKTAVVDALEGIKVAAVRPRWTTQVNAWRQMVAPPAEPPVTAVPPAISGLSPFFLEDDGR